MFLRRLICICITISFVASLVTPPQRAYAQTVLNLPEPGTMVSLSAAYTPVLIKGLKINPKNPLALDFIVATGNSSLTAQDPQLKQESEKLIKYFFAALTLPEKDVWVNLSPYEKNLIVPEATGETEMGRDMLAQDYILKQITASLIYPEKGLGKEFWNKIYTEAYQRFGTTQVPVNTFNKVWIVADKASVYEAKDTVFVVDSHLKVMLEEDYLALQKHSGVILSKAKDLNKINSMRDSSAVPQNDVHTIGSQIIREIVLPALEKEVNEGKNFANLRQIFHSLILAKWYKETLKTALLNQVYSNKNKIAGVDVADRDIKEKIYQQYLMAYKKGVFNYIKEDVNQTNQKPLPRKYFSGGVLGSLKVDMATIAQAQEAFGQNASKYVDFAILAQSANNRGNGQQIPDAAMNISNSPMSQEHLEAIDKYLNANQEKMTDSAMLGLTENGIQWIKETPRENIIFLMHMKVGSSVQQNILIDVIDRIKGLNDKQEAEIIQDIKNSGFNQKWLVLRLVNKIKHTYNSPEDWVDEAIAYMLFYMFAKGVGEFMQQPTHPVLRTASVVLAAGIFMMCITYPMIIERFTSREGVARGFEKFLGDNDIIEARSKEEALKKLRIRLINWITKKYYWPKLSIGNSITPLVPYEFIAEDILNSKKITLVKTRQAAVKGLVSYKVKFRQDAAMESNGVADAALIAAKPLLGTTPQVGMTPQELAVELGKEIKVLGSGRIPKIVTISDQHGTIDKFDQLLLDAFRSVPAGERIPKDFILNPDQTIQQQFVQFGINLDDFKGQLFFHNLEDFMDRGPFGVKVFYRSKELIDANISDFVIGNHGQWMFMNLMGLHLPTYDNFEFYGYKDSFDDLLGGGKVASVLRQKHRNMPETRTRSWWARKLAQHRRFYEELQNTTWHNLDTEVNGEEGLYNQVTNGMDEEQVKEWDRSYEGEIWGKLRGVNPDVGSVSTGVKAVGLVSIVWWEKLYKEFDVIYQSKYHEEPKTKEGRIAKTAWQTSMNMMRNRIIPELKKTLQEQITDKNEPKWWYRIFEAINSQNYTSPEWWAMDWAYHKGWGSNVFKEINTTYQSGELQVTVENYLDEDSHLTGVKVLREIAQFYKDHYNLHVRDIFQTDLLHGFLPIDPETGEFYFNYKDKHYRGIGGDGYAPWWEGLETISRDVRGASGTNGVLMENIYDALALVNKWYADNTTKAKPFYVATAFQQIGVRKIAKANGIHQLITGHIPMHDFQKLPEDIRRVITGHIIATEDGRQVFAFSDGGMGEKFGGGGKYIFESRDGFGLRGFEGKKSTEIIGRPRTIIYKKDNVSGVEREKVVYENQKPILPTVFLSSVIENIESAEQTLDEAMTAVVDGKKLVIQPRVLLHSFLGTFVNILHGGFGKVSGIWDELIHANSVNGMFNALSRLLSAVPDNRRKELIDKLGLTQPILEGNIDVVIKDREYLRDFLRPVFKAMAQRIERDPQAFGDKREKMLAILRDLDVDIAWEGVLNLDPSDILKLSAYSPDAAMNIDNATVAQSSKDFTRGGIDLNATNMDMSVTKDANGGVKVVLPSKELGLLIARFKTGNFDGIVPVIINITSIADIYPLLGLQEPQENEKIAVS